VNPYGVGRPACVHCGFCALHPCRTGAKGDAATTVIPAALATGRLEIRDRSYVIEILHDGRRAHGVRYLDAEGSLREQRADVVVLSAYTFGNVRLLLLSGMGEPYDVEQARGSVGARYGYNVAGAGAALFARETFRNYMGSLTTGYLVDDLTGAHLDPRQTGFVGGAYLSCVRQGTSVIGGFALPPGTPRWGSAWKEAIRAWYDHDVRVNATGQVLPYHDSFLDLDPRYRDAVGLPLLRLTFDWKPNERRLLRFMGARVRELLERMKADHIVTAFEPDAHFDTTRYQGTHNTGGATMGSDPDESVVNSWLQMWDFENVWVVGGSAFPQGGAHGPTGTICALAYRAAEGVLRYGAAPGPLA
jgi:gluconate 2-dehydrogenase alpha chain